MSVSVVYHGHFSGANTIKIHHGRCVKTADADAFSSAIHRYFRFWCEQGFFEAMWLAGLENMMNSRALMGSKRHLLVDGRGVPLAIVITGANRHDVSQLEKLLDSIITGRPDIFKHPQHLRLDCGYAGEPALEIIVLRGFIAHVIGRGQEKRRKYKTLISILKYPNSLI